MKIKNFDWIAFTIATCAILSILKITNVIGISWWYISAPMILIGFIIFIISMTALIIWIESRNKKDG